MPPAWSCRGVGCMGSICVIAYLWNTALLSGILLTRTDLTRTHPNQGTVLNSCRWINQGCCSTREVDGRRCDACTQCARDQDFEVGRMPSLDSQILGLVGFGTSARCFGATDSGTAFGSGSTGLGVAGWSLPVAALTLDSQQRSVGL